MAGKPKLHLQGKPGQPGLQAWQLAAEGSARGPINPWGRGSQAIHPNVMPNIFSETGMPGNIGNVAPIEGRQLGDANIAPFDYNRALSHGLAGGSRGFLGIGSSHGTPKYGIQKEADRYSEDFRTRWYNPYLEAGIRQPVQDVLRATTRPAAGFLPEDIVSGYTGPLGSMAHGQQAIAPTTPSSNINTSGYAADLGFAASDIDTQTSQLATDRGFTAEKEGFIADDRARYQSDISDIEAEKGRRFGQFTSNKVAAHKARMRGLKGGATARSAMLLGNLAGYEKAQMPYSKSGFASSGPGRQAFEASQAPLAERLRGATIKQRDTEDAYQNKIEGLETKWGEEDINFGQRVQDKERQIDDLKTRELLMEQEYATHDAKEATIASDWRDSKRGYMKGVKDLTQSVAGDIGDISDRKFGTALDESMSAPESDEGYEYRLRNQDYGAITGQSTFNSPTGGWFRETGPLPGVAQGKKDVQAAQKFGEYLGGLTEDDFGSALGENWQDLGTEDIDYETLGDN